jgi:hypothetical protein
MLGSAILQTLFFPSVENLVGTLALVFGWFVLSTLCVRESNVIFHPVSTLMMTGWSLFHFVLPMPLMLLDLKPLTSNLRVPVDTFLNQVAIVSVLALSHLCYTNTARGANPLRKLLRRTWFYVQPTDNQIWVSAALGLAGTIYNLFVFGALGTEMTDRGVMFHVASALGQFAWMPIVLLFPRFRSGITGADNGNKIYVLLYALVLSAIAISSNMRTFMYTGVILFFGMTFVGFLHGHYRIDEIVSPQRVGIGIVAGALLLGPLLDLGYAMVSIRGERSSISAEELIRRTLEIYSDDRLLAAAKANTTESIDTFKVGSYGWDESYLSNPILNRFVNYKISDNCIFYAQEIGYGNPVIREELWAQIVASLPNALLSALGYDLNRKFDTASYSIGDYLYSTAVSNRDVRGSFIISSMPGVGLAAWGYWYLLLLPPLFIILFLLFDSLADPNASMVIFSYLFFGLLVQILNYFNDRHVYTYEFRFVLRTYAEAVITFLISMRAVRTICNR